MTSSVSLAGTTKSSTSGPCPSNSSVEGYATSTNGVKSFSFTLSGGCLNMSGTFNYSFEKDKAYTFVTYLDGNNNVQIGVTSTPISSSQAGAAMSAEYEVLSLLTLEKMVTEKDGGNLTGVDTIEECSVPLP